MATDSLLLLPITLIACIAVISIVLARPFVGFCLIIFAVTFCEMFTTGDPISMITFQMMIKIRGFPLKFTPLEILMLATIISGWSKARANGDRFWIKTASNKLWIGFAVTIAFGFVWGWRRGGDFNTAIIEVRGLVYAILMYFLGTFFLQDFKRLKHVSWVFMVGVLGLILISIVRYSIVGFDTSNVDSLNGSNHDTALFFAMLTMYLLSQISFGTWKWHKFFNFLLLFPSIFSMMISGRRAAFVSLVVAYGVYLVILFIRKRKAFWITLVITVLIGAPYMAVFWTNQSSPLGMPARAIRSQLSGQASARDASSDLYRLVEKYDVHYTIMQNRIFGVGFGQPFYTPVELISLDGFIFQLYTPHVNILWIWLKVGIVGFALFWLLQCIGFFQLAQIIKYSRAGPELGFTLFAGLSLVVILVFAFVDVALSGYRLTSLMGVFLAIINLHYQKVLPEVHKFGGRKLFLFNRTKQKKGMLLK
ncbi:MAG: O-antigen ligase family protein [Chloroflexi bacterium]|uniref:O-antigen ligase family protein n=1 Tax=Candidatus Chlorohelix allophototropha TaxID=3003348 RepID=A0A8T7LV33_9CHLR|nr:O-antigen ligase family protein [Chloroflexota bacterium]WJW67748.1 O-antigen ligase family protein [Chloroflexota bacterium L227-S17]